MDYRSSVPLGKSGDWSVQTVFDDHGQGVGLFCGDLNWMVDKPEEIATMMFAVDEARSRGGQILKLGLGLGCFVDLALESPAVERITVIELSPDVLALTGSTMARHGERVRIIQADGRTWRPDLRFTVGYHDIWPDPRGQDKAEVNAVIDHFAPWCDWQGVWNYDR